MSEQVKVAIIYYSATGNVYQLAKAAAEAAEKAGAEVRLRKVHELAPAEAIAKKPKWAANAEQTKDVSEATLDDLDWADVVLMGTPTRFGTPTAQLKEFIDMTGPLWGQGKLADKVYSAFTSTDTPHGGQESTLLTLFNVFSHWGGIIVPPGYTDPDSKLGNPYGTSHIGEHGPVNDMHLDAARHQARRTVEIGAALKRGKA